MAADKFQLLTGKKQTSRSVIKADGNGNYQYGVKEDDGTITIKGEVPMYDAKAKLTKGWKTGLSSNTNTGEKKIEPKLETYTRDELKKTGWSDSQINEAVKQGKFKVH